MNCENCQFAEHLYRKTNKYIFCGLYELPKEKKSTPLCYEPKEQKTVFLDTFKPQLSEQTTLFRHKLV